MARKSKETLTLKCVLTDADRLKYGDELVDRLSKKSASEDNLKAISTQCKADIALHEATAQALSSKLKSGFEWREVECEIRYDWDKKQKEWFRKDTGESAKVDIIPEKELQEEAAL